MHKDKKISLSGTVQMRLYEDVINEEASKRGTKLLTATRKVMTCSIRKLQTKLFEKHNINTSLGTIYNLEQFYISFPTETENILCMCKLLNKREIRLPDGSQ